MKSPYNCPACGKPLECEAKLHSDHLWLYCAEPKCPSICCNTGAHGLDQRIAYNALLEHFDYEQLQREYYE